MTPYEQFDLFSVNVDATHNPKAAGAIGVLVPHADNLAVLCKIFSQPEDGISGRSYTATIREAATSDEAAGLAGTVLATKTGTAVPNDFTYFILTPAAHDPAKYLFAVLNVAGLVDSDSASFVAIALYNGPLTDAQGATADAQQALTDYQRGQGNRALAAGKYQLQKPVRTIPG